LTNTKISSKNFVDLAFISSNNLNIETNQPIISQSTETNGPSEEENEPEIKFPSNEASQAQKLRRST
jgi:hypothetical protein